jgi:hypothetical protein
MLTQEEDVEVHSLKQRGWTISEIARHTGRDRKTIRAYLDGVHQPGVRAAVEPDPFDRIEPYVRPRLVDDHGLWATTLFGEVQALGYDRSALVSVDGNRYSVPPALVGVEVKVRQRLGSDELVIVSPAGTSVATHRAAPRGVGRIVRLPEHTAALENVVLASFTSDRPCPTKVNRPPSGSARVIAAEITGADDGASPGLRASVSLSRCRFGSWVGPSGVVVPFWRVAFTPPTVPPFCYCPLLCVLFGVGTDLVVAGNISVENLSLPAWRVAMTVGLFYSVRALFVVGVLISRSLAGIATFDVPTVDEEHCVVYVLSQKADGELVLSDPRCYSTFPGAMSDASGGELVLAAGTVGSVFWTDQGVEALASTFTLGIHFDGYNGTGSSISVVGSSCTGGYWNTGSSWKDRISSSWNGCYRLKHHSAPSRGGSVASTVGAGSTHNLPSWMNDRTESEVYLTL